LQSGVSQQEAGLHVGRRKDHICPSTKTTKLAKVSLRLSLRRDSTAFTGTPRMGPSRPFIHYLLNYGGKLGA
jgi:hypothetical protein